ncbi:hypothetical protein PspLS_09632, partial [Pyricularia sp. CBS 133598]
TVAGLGRWRLGEVAAMTRPQPTGARIARADVVAAMNRLNELYDLALDIPTRSRSPKPRKGKHIEFSDSIYDKLQLLYYQGSIESALTKFDTCIRRKNRLERSQDHDRQLLQDILHQCYSPGLAVSDEHSHRRRSKRSSNDEEDEDISPKRCRKTQGHKLDVVQTRALAKPGPGTRPRPRTLTARESDEQQESANTSRTSIAPSIFSEGGDFGGTQTTAEASSQESKHALRPSSKALLKREPADFDFEPNSDEVRAFEEAHECVPKSDKGHARKTSSDIFSSFPENLVFEPSTPELRLDAAQRALQNRLDLVWPRLPQWLHSAPLAIAWEVTRIALHCKIDLGDVKGLVYDQSWDNLKTLRSVLYKHPLFQGQTFPEQCSVDAWNAAVKNFDKVVLAAELDRNSAPSGPFFTLKLKALAIEQSHRLSRRFGEDRFLEVLYPSHGSTFKDPELLPTLNNWLSHGRHSFVGRKWAAFFTKDSGYRRPAREVRLGPDPKPVLKDRIYFFAEDGNCFQSRQHTLNAPFSGNPLTRATLPVNNMLNWLLQLDLVQNQRQPWPKLFSRIQLGLSRTHPAVVFEPSEIHAEENDLMSPTGNVMNDGIGLMSRSVAREIQQILGIQDLPCAVQGRLGSAKGMWIIDPFDQSDKRWIKTYPSQRKWMCTSADPHHRTLEIKTHAKPLRSASLNLQFLPVLHDRSKHKHGMRDSIGDLLRTSLRAELESVQVALRSPQQFLQWVHENSNHRQGLGNTSFEVPRLGGLPERDEDVMGEMVRAGFSPREQKYLQDIAWNIQKQKCETLREKLNIKVGMSTYALMVVDFSGVVPEGEVHLCFSEKFTCDGFSGTLLNDQEVLVARSPTHYISDIQKVKAVFRPELKDLKDVIVFSRNGNVALADKLSGGDYDGDIAWVCWDRKIVDNFENAAVPNTPDLFQQGYLSKTSGTMSDLVRDLGLQRGTGEMIARGFEFNMRQNFLGICTNYKERLCYKRNNVNDSVAILLSALVSNLVDQGKQGIVFDAGSWRRLQTKLHRGPGSLELPLYKENSWRGARPPEHIIDHLKFTVAKPLIDKELGDFHKSLQSKSGEKAHYWDKDLVEVCNYWDGQKPSNSLNKLLGALKSDIDTVAVLWKKVMAGAWDSDRSRSEYRRRINQVYEAWLDIKPAVHLHRSLPGSKTVAALVQSYLHLEQTNWALLKASMAFKYHVEKSSSFVWKIAGAQLMLIKATAGDRQLAPVTQGMIPFLKPDKKMIDRFIAVQEGTESLYESVYASDLAGNNGRRSRSSLSTLDNLAGSFPVYRLNPFHSRRRCLVPANDALSPGNCRCSVQCYPLAAASPVENVLPGGVFTIAQEKNKHFRESTGLDALLHAFSKYNATLTPRLRAAVEMHPRIRTKLQQRNTMFGSVLAVPPAPYDNEYISAIRIGTPPQSINIAIDTESADLWVMSTDTPTSQQNGRPVYSPQRSTTSKLIPNATWSIAYGDGSGASGIAYTDRVQLGGARYDTQVVESATYASRSFTDDPWISGLMGQAGVARLHGESAGGKARKLQFWLHQPKRVHGRHRLGDTGTTLLLLPEWMVKLYYAQVAGAAVDRYWGSWVFPCASALPDFKLVVEGVVGVVPGRYMRYWQYDDRLCYGGLQSSAGLGINAFGDVLLKAQFVVFDMGQMRVGFANKKLLS